MKTEFESSKREKVQTAEGDEDNRIRHQCRPHLVFTLANNLRGRADKESIMSYFRTTGFGDILKLLPWKGGIPSSFVHFSVNNFEKDEVQFRLTDTQVLKLHGKDVHRVYNLPLGGAEVRVDQCDPAAIAKVKRDLQIDDGTNSKFVKDSLVANALLTETDPVKWSKLAILYILGTLLCPRNHPQISLKYAEVLEDMDNVKSYDWCCHVIQYLKDGIPYKGFKSPKADFHFLLINYMDRMGAESPMETGNFTVPTCHISNSVLANARLKSIESVMGFKHGITHGWTYTGRANAQISFDPDCCPIEKAPMYATWVKSQLTFFTNVLQTLETRMTAAGLTALNEDVVEKQLVIQTKCSKKRVARKAPLLKKSKRPCQGKCKQQVMATNSSGSDEEMTTIGPPSYSAKNSTGTEIEPNHSVGETVIASLLQSTSAVVEPPSPAKALKWTTSGDAEERPSSSRNNAVPSLNEPQQFLQPCPLTSNESDAHCNGKRKASDGQNSSSSFSPNNEDMKKNDDSQTWSPAKGNQVTKVVEILNDQVKVKVEKGDCWSEAPISYSEPATTECPKTCPVTTCFSPRSEKSQGWPFTKKSEMWKLIESMEVFKRIPQTPHFSPLNEHEENSREKLALCMMTKLLYEAERISAGSPDDLNTSKTILDSLKSLEELESHGFNITPLQDYLTELLSKMEEEKELKGDLEEIESGIIKCLNEKTTIEAKLSELGKQLKSLEKQIHCENAVKCLTDLQLGDLESRRGIVSGKLHNLQLTKRRSFEW